MANYYYLGPQFTVHFNVNCRFCKETPLTFKYSHGKFFCYLPYLIITIKTPIDRIRAIISICPLITDTQTNTSDW